MGEIVASVQRVTDIIGEISASSAEQSEGIHQVNGAVSQARPDDAAERCAGGGSAAAAESLKDQAAPGRRGAVVPRRCGQCRTVRHDTVFGAGTGGSPVGTGRSPVGSGRAPRRGRSAHASSHRRVASREPAGRGGTGRHQSGAQHLASSRRACR
jgi:hypothetical protein